MPSNCVLAQCPPRRAGRSSHFERCPSVVLYWLYEKCAAEGKGVLQ